MGQDLSVTHQEERPTAGPAGEPSAPQAHPTGPQNEAARHGQEPPPLPERLQDALQKLRSNDPEYKDCNLEKAGLSAEHMEALAEALAGNTTVKKLDLDGNPGIGDKGMRWVCRGIKANRSLNCLFLKDTGLTAGSMGCLCEALTNHPALTTLSFSSNHIGDAGLAAILPALFSLKQQIRSLQLATTGITRAEFGNMLALVKVCPRLALIDVGRNGLDDEAVVDLCAAIQHFKACKSLCLSGNAITDRGVTDLCTTLVDFPDVKNLWLNRNPHITNASAAHLGALKAKFPNLSLESNIPSDVIDEAAQAIRDRDTLLAFGAVPATKARLLLCGHQYAGKTTLAATLCTPDSGLKQGQQQRTRTSVKQPVAQDAANRTVGVDVCSVTLQGGGQFTLYDLAGQSQYITPHSLVAKGSAAVLVVVISLGDPKEDRRAQLEYWLRFLKARFLPSTPEQLPIVHVVLTHRDLDGHHPSDVSYLEDLEEWVSTWGEGVVGFYRKQFSKSLAIDPHVYVVDALDRDDKEMELLRSKLRESRDKVLSQAGQVPVVVEKIKVELEPMREACKAWPVLPEDKLWARLQQQNPRLPNPGQHQDRDKIVHAMMRFLQSEGEIVWISHSKLVVLSPQFLCSEIVGRLFAPEWFPVCVEQLVAGRVTVEAIEAAFPRRDVTQILAMITELDLGFAVDKKQTFLLPSLLENEPPAACAWRVPENATLLGRRLLCITKTDYFGPSFFPRLQVRLHHIFNAALTLWRDGADGTKVGVRCRVVPTFNGQGVDVWAHGPANSGMAVLTVVGEVLEQVQQVMQHDCANIQPVELALSTEALRTATSATSPATIPGYLITLLESTSDPAVPPTHPRASAPVESVHMLLGRPQRPLSDLWPCKSVNLTHGKLRILLIRSNSRLFDPAMVLTTDREEKRMVRAVRESQHAASFELRSIGDVQLADIRRELAEFRPHCVHFVGHHFPTYGFECLDDKSTQAFLGGDVFCDMVQAVAPPLPLACVVMNCCTSVEFAEATLPVAASAVCAANKIPDEYGLLFAELFWRELLGGSEIDHAFAQANAAVKRLVEQDRAQAQEADSSVIDPEYKLLVR